MCIRDRDQWEEAPAAILTSSRTQKGREEVLQMIETLNDAFIEKQ
jgi:hypothetical protein